MAATKIATSHQPTIKRPRKKTIRNKMNMRALTANVNARIAIDSGRLDASNPRSHSRNTFASDGIDPFSALMSTVTGADEAPAITCAAGRRPVDQRLRHALHAILSAPAHRSK
jgi:hypothetical protein